MTTSSTATVSLTDKKAFSAGSYLAYISPWGAGSAVQGVNYTESMTMTSNLFPNSMDISFSWPQTTVASVKSFLAIDYGDYDYTTVASPITSSQINSISTLSATTNFSMSGQTSGFDVVYDMFLTAKAGSTSAHLAELEVFLHTPAYSQSWIQGLKQIGTFTSSGTTWNVAVTTGSTKDVVVSPVGNQDITASTVDMKAIFSYLVSKGLLSGSEYFNGMAVGVEASSGTGNVNINNFSVQYSANATSSIQVPQSVVGAASSSAAAAAPVVPTLAGTLAGQTTTAGATVKPFGSATLTDSNSGAADTLTITLTGAGGKLVDGTGFSGLKSVGNDVYTLTGTAAAISAELQALSFTANAGTPNSNQTTTIRLADTSSAGTATSDSTTTVTSHTAGLVVGSPALKLGTQTASTSPTLSGTAAGATSVTLMDGNTTVGTASINAATGAFSFGGLLLSAGEHTLTATATDAYGDVSTASTMVVEVGTAATIVSELGYLQTKANLAAIELTDTHVLSVSSVAAMKTIISQDAAALAAIAGGYTFSVTTKQADGSTAISSFASNGAQTQGEIDYTNGSRTVYDYGLTGQNYTSDRKLYNAAGQLTEVDTYNASMQQQSSVQYLSGSTLTSTYTNGVVTHSEMDFANGSYFVMDQNITGKSYTSDRHVYNAAGVNTEYDTYTASGAQTAYALASNFSISAGAAAETFVVGSNFGKSTIQNFNAAMDSIALPSAEFADFATVLHDAVQTASGGVQLTAANGDQLTIANMSLATLNNSKSDFTFHA